MTNEQRAKIDIALESTGGDVREAASLLGMTKAGFGEIWDCIRSDPILAGKWDRKTAPPEPLTEVQTLARDNPDFQEDPGRVLDTERQIVEAITSEERKMSVSLERMGLNEREVEIANACRSFAHKHFSHILQYMAGGVTRASAKLMTQMDEVETRLRCVRAVLNTLDQLRTEDRDAWVDEETRLSNVYVQLSGEVRRNWEIANKGAAIIASLRRRGERGPVAKKLAFQPEPIEDAQES